MSDTDPSASFESQLSAALAAADDEGRLPPKLARQMRQAIAKVRTQGRLCVNAGLDNSLALFESLPRHVQRAVLGAIVDDDRWRLRGHELGSWYVLLLRLLWTLRLWVHSLPAPGSPLLRVTKELCDILAYGARKGPALLVYAWHRQRLRWHTQFSARPTVAAMLSLGGIEPRDLAVCYARDIPQDSRYRGFWHDPTRHHTVGVVLGVDLLPTPEGCWFAESNLDPAQRPERSALYDRDPFVFNLLEFAQRSGYQHVVVLHSDSSGIDKAMARQYEEGAKARSIKLTLVERINVPRSRYTRSYGIPPVDLDRTLVARLTSYPTALDDLFGSKPASNRALGLYQQHQPDRDLLLPATSSEPLIVEFTPLDPFPNLVYKLPDLDQGRGVYFVKAKSAAHAREVLSDAMRSRARGRGFQERLIRTLARPSGLYQRYVRSAMLAARRLYIVRAHVLITPQAIEFLSAHRVVCGDSVPPYLPAGIVLDPRPYLVNFAAGGHYEQVPREEEPGVIKAALAIGRGLKWAAKYGFIYTSHE